MSDEEKSLAGIERLPGTLFEAIEELEKDEFIQNSLGNHVANKYIEAKKGRMEQVLRPDNGLGNR